MIIHPHDKQALSELRFSVQTMVADAARNGKDGMAAKNGHAPQFMRTPWDQDRRTEDWRWSTLFGLVDGAGGTVSVRLANVPVVSSPLYEMGLAKPVFLGVGMLEYFRLARDEMGISQAAAAQLLGVVKSTIGKLESADDPKLITPMRLFRMLGGFVRYEVKA